MWVKDEACVHFSSQYWDLIQQIRGSLVHAATDSAISYFIVSVLQLLEGRIPSVSSINSFTLDTYSTLWWENLMETFNTGLSVLRFPSTFTLPGSVYLYLFTSNSRGSFSENGRTRHYKCRRIPFRVFFFFYCYIPLTEQWYWFLARSLIYIISGSWSPKQFEEEIFISWSRP